MHSWPCIRRFNGQLAEVPLQLTETGPESLHFPGTGSPCVWRLQAAGIRGARQPGSQGNLTSRKLQAHSVKALGREPAFRIRPWQAEDATPHKTKTPRTKSAAS